MKEYVSLCCIVTLLVFGLVGCKNKEDFGELENPVDLLAQFHAELRDRLHLLGQCSAKPRVAVPAGHRRRVELQDTAHIQWLRRRLHVEEKCIKSA